MKPLHFSECPVLLLAGGRSPRATELRGLIEYNGRPWLEAQLRELESVGLRRVVVALGYQSGDYLTAFPWLKKSSGEWTIHNGIDVLTAVDPEPARGAFSALQTAMTALEKAEKGPPAGIERRTTHRHRPGSPVFVLPLEVPCPTRGVWEWLTEGMVPGVEVCIPVWSRYQGNPNLLSREVAAGMVAASPLAETARLDLQLRKLPPDAVKLIDVDDPRITMSINSAADLSKLLA